MTLKRISAADTTRVLAKVVIVTMDNHLASAAARANHLLAKSMPGVTLSVHAASEWADDKASLARCIADIEQGDLVIASMLFMEDHFQPVMPALKARRDHCDAMVCIMSAGEVMKLTRMGRFSMDGTTRGPMAFLKKLRGKPNENNKSGATAGAQQMKMLRRLPKLLRFIPGTAQDVRAYFLTLQYWLAMRCRPLATLWDVPPDS
jgi:magnesium chelatase subunit H